MMQFRSPLSWFLGVATLAALAHTSSARAGESELALWAKRRVQESLIGPLTSQESERSRFSRARQPPRERRTRALASVLLRDDRGRGFVPFAVDVRFGDSWEQDLTGCVYEGTGHIYVAVGDEHRRAEFLLGKRAEPVAGVCRPKASPDRS